MSIPVKNIELSVLGITLFSSKISTDVINRFRTRATLVDKKARATRTYIA